MKARCFLSAGICLVASLAAAVGVGDSYEQVVAELGMPSGLMEVGSLTWLQFERGLVKLVDDRVVEVRLLSPEELRAQRLREQQAQARRLADGRAWKQATLSDPAFRAESGAHQLAFWRDFRIRYPEIPVHEEYAAAWERYEIEQAIASRDREQRERERAQEERIRELEERVRLAEDRSRASSHVVVSYPYVRPVAVPVIYAAPAVCTVRRERSVGVVWQDRPRAPTVTASYLDRAFGPMPTFRGSMIQSRRYSGTTAHVRLSF